MKTNHTPLSVAPDLVASYRTLVTRAAGWEALRTRADEAATLGRRAFLEGDRAAWEVVQLAEWRLQRRSHARPTEPGDVLVLDTLYRIEESKLPWEEPPLDLPPAAFCGFLAGEIGKFSSADGPLTQAMASGMLDADDWMYLGYQWLPTAVEFTRTIALASLALPRAQARLLYQNLWDEVGRGDWQHGHYLKLRQFLEPFGVQVDDEDQLLDWATPESVALANSELRMLWHPEPGWGLGSLYLAEKLVPSELGKVRDAALKLRLGAEAMSFLDEHVVLDVEHADDWLGIIGDVLTDRASQVVTYNAAVQRGRQQRAAWDAALPAYFQWKQTGIAPRLPARELGAAVAGADR